MAADIHVNDVGTAMELDVLDQNNAVVNISSAGLQMSFLRPDGSTFTKNATFVTDGTDGKMHYVTQAGDLNIPGNWKMQGILTFPGGLWHTDVQKFKVLADIAG